MQHRVVDLFAGAGGLSYGFHDNPHFEVVAANEIQPEMAMAYQMNYKVRMLCKDIKEVGRKDIPEGADIVVGGPPCQAYSTIGTRDPNDKRGELFRQYRRILKELDPQLFLFENVSGLLSMNGGKLFPKIKEAFSELGYVVEHRLLNAADYGVPQLRERVIVVGTKRGVKFEFPSPTHGRPGLPPHVTLSQAIGDLPPVGPGERGTEYAFEPQNRYQERMRRHAFVLLQDHDCPKYKKDLVGLMKWLPDGGSPNEIDAKYKAYLKEEAAYKSRDRKSAPKMQKPKLPEECKKQQWLKWFSEITRFGNTYCRLWWDKPSTTITQNLGTPSSSRCIHPTQPRALTTREGARVQSFPDSYQFYGSRATKNIQVGNAVPPLLSEALAGAVLRHMETT